MVSKKRTGMMERFRSIVRYLAAGVMILALTACSKHSGSEQAGSAMSERQRDSAIAKSRLPGAGTVGKALAASDSAAARAARADSLYR
jgi:hypothetical protein